MEKKKAEKHSTKVKNRFSQFLIGALGFFSLFAVILFVGSIYMRSIVAKKIRQQALTASSVILTRPYPLKVGDDFYGFHIRERLTRLGYQNTSSLPTRAGEYQVLPLHVHLYLNELELPSGEMQREQLVQLDINQSGQITRLADFKFQQEISRIWLEPETLALLGNSDTVATLPKSLNEFSPYLVKAIISIEDERFYHHFGLDPFAILRAIVTNLRQQKVVQGGSTITQQLAKNLFLTRERTLSRKIIEAFSALLLETAYTKDQILEFYLNQVFLGQEGRVAIHGFGEATKSFFGKTVADLSLAEAATLAGIIKAPSKYSPRRFPKLAKTRRDIVLHQMRKLKMIDDQEEKFALAEALQVSPAKLEKRIAPYFVDFVRNEIQNSMAIDSSDITHLKIYSSIDRELQQCAEDSVTQGLKNLEKQFPKLKKKGTPLQAALIAVTPSDGTVVAWVGGRSYQTNQFDRISLAKRQPGSAFKPFVYLTALDKSLNSYRVARTTSTLMDAPITMHLPGTEPWEPKNYDQSYRGEVTVREALVYSLNIPTVQLAEKVGIQSVVHTASLFGFGEQLPPVYSLALGSVEVTPYALAQAYTGLASGGLLVKLRPILAVTSEEEDAPLFAAPLQETRVASEQAVFVLTDLLQGVINSGTGKVVRQLGLTGSLAGKTGTSNDTRDTWFAGYHPRLLAVVWVGFDNNTPTGLTGANGAAPLWASFMKCSEKLVPPLEFISPPGVLYRRIDQDSGLLATAECPHNSIVTEIYVSGTEPVTTCPLHGVVSTPYHRDEDTIRPRPERRKQKTLWENIFSDLF